MPVRLPQPRAPLSELLAIGPDRPGPALRRGFLVAVPVGLAMLFELGLGGPTKAALRSNLGLDSTSARHALRFGVALAAGVAAYWILGMEEHGFWIPLTILFVLRPVEEETFRRLALRALGTAVGLVLATALSFWLRGDGVALAAALTLATGLAYGLLTVQYALFTAAITTYAVLLADTLGEPAVDAAAQRGLATAIGIAIAGASFLLWPNPKAPELEAT